MSHGRKCLRCGNFLDEHEKGPYCPDCAGFVHHEEDLRSGGNLGQISSSGAFLELQGGDGR